MRMARPWAAAAIVGAIVLAMLSGSRDSGPQPAPYPTPPVYAPSSDAPVARSDQVEPVWAAEEMAQLEDKFEHGEVFSYFDTRWEPAAGPLLSQTSDPGDSQGRVAPSAETGGDDIEAPIRGEEAPPERRVGIQAGHWKSAELPVELARLRTSTGTFGGGTPEWQLNLDVARLVAGLLEAEGIAVDVIPATVPPGYMADAFVALHADGDASGRLSGFKLARATRSVLPEADDALLAAIAAEYGAVTRLPEDYHVSRNMTGYYAFASRRFKHAVAATTPSVILEMGFLTSASDRRVLLGMPETVAEGIARGILRFLGKTGA